MSDSVFKIPRSCEESTIEVWERDGLKHCGYCGSMEPVELANLIKEGKATMHGSDWKYGYPHKFYVTIENVGEQKVNAKFYTNHLQMIDETTFFEIGETINNACGISFSMDEKGLKYAAPWFNYQKD